MTFSKMIDRASGAAMILLIVMAALICAYASYRTITDPGWYHRAIAEEKAREDHVFQQFYEAERERLTAKDTQN